MRINTKGLGRQEAADVMHCRRARTCLTLAGTASGSWEQLGQSSRNEISLKRLLSCMAHIWCGPCLRQIGTGHRVSRTQIGIYITVELMWCIFTFRNLSSFFRQRQNAIRKFPSDIHLALITYMSYEPNIFHAAELPLSHHDACRDSSVPLVPDLSGPLSRTLVI